VQIADIPRDTMQAEQSSDLTQARAFAAEWISAWNAHDLDRILSHYATDVVFLSPFAQKRVGHGRVIGHEALRAYWGPAIAPGSTLRFELIEVLVGFQALTIHYNAALPAGRSTSNGGKRRAAETFEFGADGKVVRSMACYVEA
jgi:ketosteroid isomerase-like protein